ncbi:uncharacterized protein [Physcomitrium patens]|uniref:uncharacterized protein isoform X3 n=1 Tax=Physcomitrium patens TaxID=3218 RepID=UPI003CCD049A
MSHYFQAMYCMGSYPEPTKILCSPRLTSATTLCLGYCFRMRPTFLFVKNHYQCCSLKTLENGIGNNVIESRSFAKDDLVWWKADLASATPPHGKTLEILIQSTLQRHIRKPPQVASDDEC